jgi:hypothetical protein
VQIAENEGMQQYSMEDRDEKISIDLFSRMVEVLHPVKSNWIGIVINKNQNT